MQATKQVRKKLIFKICLCTMHSALMLQGVEDVLSYLCLGATCIIGKGSPSVLCDALMCTPRQSCMRVYFQPLLWSSCHRTKPRKWRKIKMGGGCYIFPLISLWDRDTDCKYQLLEAKQLSDQHKCSRNILLKADFWKTKMYFIFWTFISLVTYRINKEYVILKLSLFSSTKFNRNWILEIV